MNSITRTIIISIVAAVCAVSTLSGAAVYFFARGRLVEQFDRAMWTKPVSYTHLTLPTTPYV